MLSEPVPLQIRNGVTNLMRDIGYGNALTNVTLEVRSIADLRYIMSRLLSIPGVQSVSRNGQA